MSRIVRKAPSIQVFITKGFSRTSVDLSRTRQTPSGYVGRGRITFSHTTYDISIDLEDTGKIVSGTAVFTVIGSGSLRGRQSEASLRSVPNNTKEVTAAWPEIPLPGTAALATIRLTAERNNRDRVEGGSRFPASASRARTSNEPRSLRAYLMQGGNSQTSRIPSGGKTASGKKKTPCESQGWPTCCPKVEEGRIILPE